MPSPDALRGAARRFWLLGLIGFVPIVAPRLGSLRLFLLCFLASGLLDLAAWSLRRREAKAAPAEPGPELPLPGPAQRSGPLLFLARYHLSALLALLNPFQTRQLVRQIRGEGAARRRVPVLPEAGSWRPSVEYRLPFEGEWLVMNGGVTPGTSHSWDLVAQRYAYDFVVADAEGRRHADEGTRREQYHCYGRPLLAPADGEVVHARDGVRDAPSVGTGWLDWLSRDFGGNSVTLRHAEGEYSHFAHLIPGSLRVRAGERVAKGAVVGLCGHSGHSTEPHLHFQLQDHPDFYLAVGLPIAFSDCVVDGVPTPGPIHLQRGMRVAPGATQRGEGVDGTTSM